MSLGLPRAIDFDMLMSLTPVLTPVIRITLTPSLLCAPLVITVILIVAALIALPAPPTLSLAGLRSAVALRGILRARTKGATTGQATFSLHAKLQTLEFCMEFVTSGQKYGEPTACWAGIEIRCK